MQQLKIVMYFLLFNIALCSYGQKLDSLPIITADRLASGNYKDVLTSFFQLAVKDLTGPNKAVGFSSNVFAIMLRANPLLAIDTSYLKYTALRNLNISLSAGIDSNYHLNGFASGIKYAIINKRDITISRNFLVELSKNGNEFHKLGRGLDDAIKEMPEGDLQDTFLIQKDKFIQDTTLKFNELNNDFKKLVIQVAKDSNLVNLQKLCTSNPDFNVRKKLMEKFEDLKNDYQNKALCTIGISDTSYSNGKLFKTVELSSQFLKGIIHPSKAANLELDIKATLNYGDDSMRTGKKLDRQIFSFEPGVNLVLKGKNKQSYLEFKLSGSYNNIWKGSYAKETQIVNTINGTLRLRIFDELWLPLRITYDPKRGNIFGFLNVVTNFTGLGKFLNPKKPAS